MQNSQHAANEQRSDRVRRAATRAESWITAATDAQPSALAALLREAEGRAFAVDLADRVVRPESLRVAANALHALQPPATLPWATRSVLKVSGALAPILPSPTVPVSRKIARDLFHDLVVDIDDDRADATFAQLRESAGRVIVRPLGPGVLGNDGAERARERVSRLLASSHIDAVVVPLVALTGTSAPWAFAEVVDGAASHLVTMLEVGKQHDTSVVLEPTGAQDLDIAIAVLTNALERVGATGDGGVVLDPGVWDTLPALRELTAWSRASEIPVRVMLMWTDPAADRVRAATHGWEPDRTSDIVDLGAQFMRCIEWALRETYSTVRLSVPGTDPFLAAFAIETANDTSALDRVDIVLSRGAAPEYVAALTGANVAVSVLAPTAPHRSTDAAAWIARRMHEVGEGGLFDIDPARFAAEADIAIALRDVFFETARAAAEAEQPAAHQDRAADPDGLVPVTRVLRSPAADDDGLTQEVMGIARAAAATDTSPISRVEGMLFGGASLVETAVFHSRELANRSVGAAGFRNTADTDPATEANRSWVANIMARVPASRGGSSELSSLDDAPQIMERAAAAAAEWAAVAAIDRAEALREATVTLERYRGAMVETIMAEAGLVFGDADAAVSRAIDLLGLSAASARELDTISGAVAVAPRVTLVVPSATDLSSVLAGISPALAVGSAVVIAPQPGGERQAALVAAALVAGGVSPALVTVMQAASVAELEAIVASGALDRANVFTTQTDANVLQTMRPELDVAADLDGPSSMIVTPSADIDAAVTDLVRSAFTASGQARGTLSVAILVGSTGRSDRFTAQLLDAVRSLRVAHPEDPRAEIGPLAAAPSADALWALTELGDGEAWFVQPEEREPRLWSPGVRVGVRPDSRMHTEWFAAPVLGIMHASTLTEAVRLQNRIPGALAAAIHTQDRAELDVWLAGVNAPDLVVSDATATSRAQRKPVGGWEGSSLGAPGKSGGPNRLVRLTGWRAASGSVSSSTLHLRGLDTRVSMLVEAAQPGLEFGDFEWVRRAALADAVAWDREFGRIKDVTHLGVERNLFRYQAVPVAIRATADANVAHVLRVVVAAIRGGSRVTLSGAVGLPAEVRHTLTDEDITVFVETDDEWLDRMRDAPESRARLIGRDTTELRARLRALRADIAIFHGDVTTAGRIELLTFLEEQTITIAAHRFGERDDWSSSVI